MLATPRAEASERTPELDGIRGLAVLMVIYGHYVIGPLSTELLELPDFLLRAIGYSRRGVELFFVLSGFLIGGILLDNRQSRHYFSTFYVRRFWRIVPLYAALLLITLIGILTFSALGARSMEGIFDLKLPWYVYPLFLQNFFAPFAENQTLGNPTLAVTWSLALEEQFYVTLPLLIWLLRKRIRTLALAVGFLVFLAPVVRALLVAGFPGPGGEAAAQFYMPARMDDLGLGVLSAMAVRSETYRGLLSKSWLLSTVALVCSVDLLFPTLLVSLPLGAETSMFLPSRLAGVFACLLLMAVLFRHSAWAKFLRLRPMVVAGTIAYGAYLLHFPILWIAMRVVLDENIFSFGSIYDPIVRILAFLITIVLALLSWHYFEKPLVKKGHRRKY